jgi:hypothetical protein
MSKVHNIVMVSMAIVAVVMMIPVVLILPVKYGKKEVADFALTMLKFHKVRAK